VRFLAERYRAKQHDLIAALTDRHWDGPSLRQARRAFQDELLVEPDVLDRLPADAERDAAGRRAQADRQSAYLEWRKQAARQLARKAGPLGRLAHPSVGFYPELDRAQLTVCARCEEIVYPSAHEDLHIHGQQRRSPCHYCGESNQLDDYTDQSPPAHEHERRS
jgi:hypothetical protein